MRRKATILVLALAGFSPGCALIQDGVHNMFAEVQDCVDDTRERARNRQWAKQAWAQVCGEVPEGYSKEYAQGFKDGFAEYLFCGKPEPPPVAPQRFRSFTYQTPAGYHAIQEWFAGYRHGVSVAVESGYRRWVTAPVAVPQPPLPPPPVMPVPPPPAPIPGVEVLPPPRPVQPETKPKQETAPPHDAVRPQEAQPPQRDLTLPQEIILPPQETVHSPQEAMPRAPVIVPPKTAPLPAIAPPQALARPAIAPPVTITRPALAPSPAIMLPPGPAAIERLPTVDWGLPQPCFGMPRAMDAPSRPGLLGTLLPPQALPPEDGATFEEQEPPFLGLPRPTRN